MATGTVLASKAGKLAAIGIVCVACIISKHQLGFIFKLMKQILAPPYIYLLFNFILFCILSSSFWSTSFKSLIRIIHNFLAIFQSAGSSNTAATTTTYNNHEHAFVSYFTRQTSTLFENFNWGSHNISHKEEQEEAADVTFLQSAAASAPHDIIKQEEEQSSYSHSHSHKEVSNSAAVHYNRTLPFDGVSRVIKHTENNRSWFSSGNDHNLYDGFQQRNIIHDTSSSYSKNEDPNIVLPEQYTEPSNIKEDEEIELIEGDEVGNDMDSTWKAIMEGKKNKLLIQDQNRLQQQPAAVLDPPTSHQLNYSARSGHDNKKLIINPAVKLNNNNNNNINKCPPPPTPDQLRRGSGEASGGKKRGGGGGWRRNMMEELVTGQDELYHRAEAFINRFKNGIQLQRIDSYQRFLELINR